MARAIRYLALLTMAFVALLLTAAYAAGATVTGKFVTRDGQPIANRQLHFENVLSGDIFIVHTGKDGIFSANLPPGTYDLRAEHGVVLKSPILIGNADESLGSIEAKAPADFMRLFERETLVPPMIESAAPSTANVETTIAPQATPSPNASPSMTGATE